MMIFVFKLMSFVFKMVNSRHLSVGSVTPERPSSGVVVSHFILYFYPILLYIYYILLSILPHFTLFLLHFISFI